jgi:hypothetical protein
MSKRQKQIAIIGGAAVALIVIYKWWQNRQASNAANAGAATTSTDPNSSDYAALAGQEQGDTAALQQQYQQLMAQEQSDVAALQAQQQSAAADASRQIGDFMNFPPGYLAQLPPLPLTTTPATSVPSVATGTTPVNRTAAKPFKPIPPKYAPVGSVWRGPSSPGAGWRGIGAGWWAPPLPHPSAPKQTHVGHPNGDHTAKTQVAHPNQPIAKVPTPKPPPKPSKPKKSGVHR